MIAYAELLARTNCSFLTGASHPDEMVFRAQELGLHALGIADVDGVYGIVKAHAAAGPSPQGAERPRSEEPRRGKERGLKLVVGARMTVGTGTVALLAKDLAGYGAICTLVTTGRMRNKKGVCSVTLDEIASEARGTCHAIAMGPERAGELREIFGADLSIAVSRTMVAGDERRIAEAVATGVPLVATNEPLFHVPERRVLHDVLTAIREKTTVAKLGKKRLPNAERHLKTGDAMAKLFADHPEAIARTVDIADACTFSLDQIRYRYPDEWLPHGFTAMGWLRALCEMGIRWRFPNGVPADVRQQLEHELRIIEQLDFPAYFLTVWDIVDWARSRKILCQGRGSAANSVVCYLLGMTSIDPVRMNLLFERFMSAERGEPPDIDVDFEHERREEVIQHVYEKYGRNRAAMVANLITYRHRMAVREAGKALGLSLDQVDRLSRAAGERDLLSWGGRPRTSANADHENVRVEDLGIVVPGAREKFLREAGVDPFDRTVQQVLDVTRELIGFPRHLGIHSGGFCITHGELHRLVPTENATMPGRSVVQWDKDDLAAAGLLKIDVLALGMLTMIRKALDLICEHGGPRYDIATIPAEDPAVYDMVCEADTVGVFQIESRAQMNTLPRMLPRSFYDLVIEIALIRPGPITGGMVGPLLRRRRGQEPVVYAHPSLEPILARTYGVPVFQEQAIRLAVVAAGFTPGEADELRRVMTHKRSTERLAKLHGRLLAGMAERGIGPEKAEEIVMQLSGFAGYGFPESHSASFALLVYASAWLKRRHHAAFSCALLNSWPMGFYAPHTIVDDAKRHAVDVRGLDVTRSRVDCTLEENRKSDAWGSHLAIRIGYRYVRGLNEKQKKRLAETAPFTSWDDMVQRARLPREAMARIAAADAFASLGMARRDAIWAALRMPPGEGEVFADGGHGEKHGELSFPSLDPKESVVADYDALGLSTAAHPASFFRESFARRGILSAAELARQPNRKRVKVGGMSIVRQRPPTAGNLVFQTLEDETGFLNLVIKPEVYDAYRSYARDALFVVVDGIVERQGNAINVQAIAFEDPEIDGPLRVTSRDFH